MKVHMKAFSALWLKKDVETEAWEHSTKSGLHSLYLAVEWAVPFDCSIYHSNWLVYTDNDIIFIL